MALALPLLLALVAPANAQAPSASGKQVSGQVVAVGAQGRLTLNLTAAHVKGGERAQIVRQTTTGGWVRAAVGDVAEVTHAGSVLVVTRYEPNMAAAVVGDYVIVTPAAAPAPPSAGAGYPGYAGAAPATVPPAPTELPFGAAAAAAPLGPPKQLGDELAVAFGVKYMAAFSGKEEPDQAPPDESGKAGFGWSVGPAIELRGWKYVALETGLSFYSNNLKKKTTTYTATGRVCQVEQEAKSTALRLPLLIKGVLPIVFDDELGLRLSLGTGLEWAFGRDSELGLKGDGCEFQAMTDTPVKAVNQRFFVLNIGVAVTVQDVIIGLDIRASYNGDNSPKFEDYFNGDTEPMEHTVDAGVLLGVSYEYDAL